MNDVKPDNLTLYALPNKPGTFAALEKVKALETTDSEGVVCLAAGWQDVYNQLVEQGAPCWVGQVSWAQALATGDSHTWVPAAVGNVAQLVPDRTLVEITTEAIDQITAAMDVPNESGFSEDTGMPGVNESHLVRRFLEKHLGDLVLAVTE